MDGSQLKLPELLLSISLHADQLLYIGATTLFSATAYVVLGVSKASPSRDITVAFDVSKESPKAGGPPEEGAYRARKSELARDQHCFRSC
jgi:hypothetical protein